MTTIHREVLDLLGAKAFAGVFVSGAGALQPVAGEILALANAKVSEQLRQEFPLASNAQEAAVAILGKGLADGGRAGLTDSVRAVYESVFMAAGLSIEELYTTGEATEPGADSQDARVAKKVKGCIAEILGIPSGEVLAEQRIVADLGADSLDLVEIIMSIEDELCIEVTDEDAERVCTVQEAIDLAGKLVHRRGPL